MSKCGVTDGLNGKMVAVIATDRHNVSKHLPSRVPVTAGTIIGVTEINGQELPVNTTEDVLMATTGVDDAIVLDRPFAKPNQELSELFHLKTI